MPDNPSFDQLITAYAAFQTFEERCYLLLDAIAEAPRPDFDLHRRLMHYALAKLATGHGVEQAFADIAWVNANPDAGNMFVWHVNIDAYLRFRHMYPPELEEAVRFAATSHAYEIHHGQTENHKLMIAVAGYLVAQTWPDWSQADATYARMEEYLSDFFDRVVRYGQGEFDSPTYSVLYLNTLATLYDFAADPRMRRKAKMMLDWFLVNMAGEWLDGLFPGAHSRDYNPTAGYDDATGGRAAGWLYLGGYPPDLTRGEPHYAVINALSGYRPPEIITYIAEDRTHPYVHRETHDLVDAGEPTHDGNETIELNDEVQGFGYIARRGVYKTTYVTENYALGSMVDGKQGDIIWAGHLRRWSLTWRSGAPASVLFFTHPFPDGRGDEAYRRLWRGSSPYEQVLQHKNALIAVYNIPQGETYEYAPREPVLSDRDPFIEGFFPEDALLRVEEDPSGWIFAHGGTVLIAVRPLRPYGWDEDEPADAPRDRGVRPHRRLHSRGLKNGVVLEVADPADFGGDGVEDAVQLHRFREAVLAKTSVESDLDAENPKVVYKTLNGDRLESTYDGDRIVNGVTLTYEDWPVIGNPFAHSPLGAGRLTLRYGALRRVLDFNTWRVEEELI